MRACGASRLEKARVGGSLAVRMPLIQEALSHGVGRWSLSTRPYDSRMESRHLVMAKRGYDCGVLNGQVKTGGLGSIEG